MKKIHTGTYFRNFGDGFFSVFNPDGEEEILEITTSNNQSDHRNTVRIPAKLGLFQCLQVTKKYFKNKSYKKGRKTLLELFFILLVG